MGSCFTTVNGVFSNKKIYHVLKDPVMHHVLVVDDHKAVCQGLAALISNLEIISKIYTAFNAKEAIAIVNAHKIDVALIDARMPQTSGVSLAERILNEYPSTKIIGITSFDEDETIIEMLQTGMHGILLKRNTDRSEINHCLLEVFAGRKYYTPEIQIRLSNNDYNLTKSIKKFTYREQEVLQLICAGEPSKGIAEKLQLKDSTIEGYRKEMLKKTATKNTAELVSYALRNGLV